MGCQDGMLGRFPVGSNRIRVEDLWKNVMAVEKYEGEKKLLTGASGDLSRPQRKRSFRCGSDAAAG
jgi:hypothetical protein